MVDAAFIRKLSQPGLGRKRFPDNAMDVGTRGLIDVTYPWSWGGTKPVSGSTLAVGTGPLNYVEAGDGFPTDAASNLTANVYQYSGILLGAGGSIKMPSGFIPKTGDTHMVWIMWATPAIPSGASGFNNTWMWSDTAAGAVQMQVVPEYSSGALTAIEVVAVGFTGPKANLYIPAKLLAPIMDAAPHQIAVEIERNNVLSMGRMAFYIDGALVIEGGWQPTTADYAAFASDSRFGIGKRPAISGTGLGGFFFRAMAHDLSVTGMPSATDLVTRDYSEMPGGVLPNNAARILAAQLVA